MEEFEAINKYGDELIERLKRHQVFTKEETQEFFVYGLKSIPTVLNKIYKIIDENGYEGAKGIITTMTFDAYYELLNAEFYSKTSIYFALSRGNEIPYELINLHVKGTKTLRNIDNKLHYPIEELDEKFINQKQLIQLIMALSNHKIIKSSPTLIIESLCELTNYRESSLRTVVFDTKRTKGGFSEEEKKTLISKITHVINKF